MTEYRDIVGPASSNKGTDIKLYDTLSDRPTASTFGVGQCQIGSTVYVSDGVNWNMVSNIARVELDNMPVSAFYKEQIGANLTPAWTFSGTVNDSSSAVVLRSTISGLSDTVYDINGYALHLKTTGAGSSSAYSRATRTPIAIDGATNTSIFVIPVYLPSVLPSDAQIVFVGYDGANSPVIVYQQSSWKQGLNYLILDASTATPAVSGTQTYNRIDIFSPTAAVEIYILDFYHFVKGTVIKAANVIDARIGSNFKGRAEPRVIVEFDDAWSSVFTIAFPLMVSRGIVGTIAVIAARVGTAGYCTQAQLLEMQNAGWELTVHGDWLHDSGLGTYDSIYADVKSNQDYIKNLGGNYQSYVYPGGHVLDGVSNLALKNLGFKSARTTSFGNDLICGLLGDEDPYKSKGYTLNNTNYANISTLLAKAVASCSTLRLYGHKIAATVTDATLEISTANLTTLLNTLVTNRQSGLITISTVAQYETAFGLR